MRIALTLRSTLLMASLLLLAACSSNQVLNSFSPESGTTMTSNVPYDRGNNLGLDIYSPYGALGAPVVMFVHGGRWQHGSKEDFLYVGQALASRGYVAVVIDFRQYPDVRFPAFVEDAAHAVKWIRDNIGGYGGDGNRLFVMGHSSGAHIAALLTLDPRYLKAVGGTPRGWLRGMIGLAGPYDFLPITDPSLRDMFGPPENFRDSQPITFVDGRNPPMLLMAGEDDRVVSVANTRNLASAIAKARGPVETVIYPRMSHDLILASLGPGLRSRNDVLDNIANFIEHGAEAAQRLQSEPTIKTQPLPTD